MQAVVADDEAPTAPSNVQTSVTGNTVTVTWGASTDNVAVTGYEVHRSDTADFTPSGATFITEVDGSTLSVVNGSVPAGTSYYKIVALDAAGNTTASTPAASAAVPDVTAPSAPANVQADVSGSDVSVSWDASTDDVAVTGYTVHRGATAGFSPDGATRLGPPMAVDHHP